ncbi:MAG: hypothetical protein J6Y22_00170, partial [Paludibacteraceae bacterium]|nr:hypothetical protein [Paludibacteraceae bacterium]
MRKLLLTLVTLIVASASNWAQETVFQLHDSTAYDKEKHMYNVTLISEFEGVKLTVSGKNGKHDYVDLGLPSGVLWATCNIGAKSPVETGDFFSWGEIKKKKEYNWNTYKWSKITKNGTYKDANGKEKPAYKKVQTKYCANSYIEYEGKKYVKKGADMDSMRTLLPEDDAATAQWGNKWRMPTIENMEELIEWCDWFWVPNYNKTGVAGIMGVSKKNESFIFFPAAGFMFNKSLNEVGKFGAYWSSNLEKNVDYMQNMLDPSAKSMGFYFGTKKIGGAWVRSNWDDRMFGMLVRAV